MCTRIRSGSVTVIDSTLPASTFLWKPFSKTKWQFSCLPGDKTGTSERHIKNLLKLHALGIVCYLHQPLINLDKFTECRNCCALSEVRTYLSIVWVYSTRSSDTFYLQSDIVTNLHGALVNQEYKFLCCKHLIYKLSWKYLVPTKKAFQRTKWCSVIWLDLGSWSDRELFITLLTSK